MKFYVTKTGGCYHREGCEWLKSRAGSITPAEAKTRLSPKGVPYTACRVCIDNDWLTAASEVTTSAAVLLTGGVKQQLYVTDKGQKYHVDGCKWLGSSCIGPLAFDDLERRGYQPCSVCLETERAYIPRTNAAVIESLRITRASTAGAGSGASRRSAAGSVCGSDAASSRGSAAASVCGSESGSVRAARAARLRAAAVELAEAEARVAALKAEILRLKLADETPEP